MRLAVAKKFDPARPLAVEYDARHQRAGEHCQIMAVHVGIGIGTKDGQAAAVTNADIGDRRATFTLHHFAVLIIEGGNTEGSGGLQHGWGDRIGIARRFHINDAALTAPQWVGLALPVLDATVNAEDGFIVPAGITCLVGEIVPVILVSARPYHRIDARTAAEHLPHRERQPAPVEQWIGRGLKSPIPF
jgi:hypothetical protein